MERDASEQIWNQLLLPGCSAGVDKGPDQILGRFFATQSHSNRLASGRGQYAKTVCVGVHLTNKNYLTSHFTSVIESLH